MRNVRMVVLSGLLFVACGTRPPDAPTTTATGPVTTEAVQALALQASGALDRAYGVEGVATTSGHRSRLSSFAVQTDGQALLFKYTGHAGHTISALVRFKANGLPDAGFGTAGTLTFPEAQGGVALLCPRGANAYNDWGAACEDPQRPVVALVLAATGQLSLRRYLPSGQPDASFGQAGVATTSFQIGNVVAVRVQADGKTVVAGEAAVARFTRDGRPDSSFGTGGLATLGLPAGSQLADLVLDDAERLLVLNNVYPGTATQILRLTPAGKPDPRYAGAGRVTLDFGPSSQGTTLLKLNSGRLLVGGTGGLWQLLPNGAPDPAFGTAGHVTVPLADGFDVTGLAQDDGNRLVASVLTGSRFTPLFQGNLARFLPDGALDHDFAAGGLSSVSLCPACAQTGGLAEFDGVTVLRGGRLLGVGTSGHGDHLLVARLFP